MATYNGEKYINEQIQSILKQSHQNLKLIIHDDNSKDNTVEIIKNYLNDYPDKVKLIDDNIGTGGAKENFTYLLNNIDDKYDYVMFCDQDDIWLENKIELTLNKMLEMERESTTKPILIHTDLKVVDEELRIISKSMHKYQKLNLNNQKDVKMISLENIITGCTMMINRPLVLMSKDIPDEAIMHDWWIAIITLRESGKVGFVDEGTILYRQHELNTIGSKKINLSYYLKKLLKLKEVINDYKSIYIQYKKAGINMSVFYFVINKTAFILRKI